MLESASGSQQQHVQVTEMCEQFVKHFVVIFESQLSAYHERLIAEKSKPGKWATFINKALEKAGKSVDDPLHKIAVGSVVFLCKIVINAIGRRNSLASAQKVERYLQLFSKDPDQAKKELILSGIEIFQCFEWQFMQVADDYFKQSAMEKLAKDAVNRVIDHFKNEVEKFTTQGITRGLVQGKSKIYENKESSSFPNMISPGEKLRTKQNETWTTAEVFSQPGLVKINETKQYFKSKNSKPTKYGYRLLFKWESDEFKDFKKEVKPEGQEYSYVLTDIDVEMFTEKLTNLTRLGSVSEELAEEQQKEAGDCVNKFITMVMGWRNWEENQTEVKSNIGKLTVPTTPEIKQVWFEVDPPITTFVGRKGTLNEVAEGLEKGIVVLCGFSGMGKKELARKYAQDHCKEYNNNVIWINASSPNTSKGSFFKLAKERLGINLFFEDKEEKSLEMIVNEVYDYFNNNKCLFIFDAAKNLESVQMFLPSKSAPSTWRPHIFILSQFRVGWESDRCTGATPLSLFEFTDEEAREYVMTVLNIPHDGGVDEFVKKLHNFPLALYHAVTYIIGKNKIHQKYTTYDYVKEFKKSKGNKKPISKHAAIIHETLQVAVNNIDPKTVEMLNILSCFAPNNVPSILLQKHFFHNNEAKMVAGSEELERYSLTKLENGVLSMHGFVQTVRREMLKLLRKEEASLKAGLEMFKNKVREYKNIDLILPHVMSLWNHAYQYDLLIEVFIVKDILEKKPHLNYFHLIANSSSYEVFSVIMEKIERNFPDQFVKIIGADDGQGGTPLHNAASNADTRLLKLLIEKGAKVNAKTKHGWTPLLLAVKNGNSDHAKILIESKARIDDHTKYGHTSLHIAARNDYLNIVSVLLSNGADVNARCKNQFTPLHFAAKMNNLKVVQLLLNQPGVDVNAATEFQLTPLVFAAKAGHLECVEALLLRGADANASDGGGFTPLHSAACNGHVVVVSALLKDKAIDVNLRTTKGNTALHLAAEKGHLEIVKALIAKNALVDIKNVEGNLASDLAIKEQHIVVFNLIRCHNNSLHEFLKELL